jgi:hypothetical protein
MRGGKLLVHLLDATALLALNQLQGEYLLLELTEVLDVVLEECNHPKHFNSAMLLQNSSLVTIETLSTWIQNAQIYHLFGLSPQDALNLYYAKSAQRTLITGSSLLQGVCEQEEINMQSCSSWIQQICSC